MSTLNTSENSGDTDRDSVNSTPDYPLPRLIASPDLVAGHPSESASLAQRGAGRPPRAIGPRWVNLGEGLSPGAPVSAQLGPRFADEFISALPSDPDHTLEPAPGRHLCDPDSCPRRFRLLFASKLTSAAISRPRGARSPGPTDPAGDPDPAHFPGMASGELYFRSYSPVSVAPGLRPCPEGEPGAAHDLDMYDAQRFACGRPCCVKWAEPASETPNPQEHPMDHRAVLDADFETQCESALDLPSVTLPFTFVLSSLDDTVALLLADDAAERREARMASRRQAIRARARNLASGRGDAERPTNPSPPSYLDEAHGRDRRVARPDVPALARVGVRQ